MSSGIVESSNQGSSQQQSGSKRSKLVERLLDASANLPAFMNDLLSTMAVTVAGTEAAGFLLEQTPEGQSALRKVTHIRPDESDDDIRERALQAFREIIGPCIQQGRDGAIEVGPPDEEGAQFCLVTLLRNEGQTVAAAAVITRCRDQERARQRLMSIQLVAGYFELFMMRRQMEQSRELALRHQNVLQLTTSVATAEGFEAAAMNFCTELASRAGASRVTMGWLKGGRNIKVKALSHTEKFDKKQDLIVKIERVMEECLDQEEPVRFDADGTRSQNVTREAESLCRSQGNSSVYSVPLRRRGEIVGVVTLEFTPPARLSDEVANALAVTSDLLAPQLWDRHENDRWLIVKTGKSIANVAKKAIGPKHMLAKLIIALVIGAGCFLWLYKPMYHVSAPFQFVSAQKRSITAPFDGQIGEVNVKAGQRFKKGDVLMAMRTEEVQARRIKATADRDAYLATYRRLIADREDPTAAGRAQEALKNADAAAAELKLYDYQLENARRVAPFNGIVLRGDLDDKLNATIKQGEPLMEIQETSEALKAELAVAERDIHLVRARPEKEEDRAKLVGWQGTLATNALPTRDIKFHIERVIPLGEANQKEADNTFKVVVVLEEQPDFIRPGMAGEARIDAGRERLAWIWTHRLIDWLRLKLWW